MPSIENRKQNPIVKGRVSIGILLRDYIPAKTDIRLKEMQRKETQNEEYGNQRRSHEEGKTARLNAEKRGGERDKKSRTATKQEQQGSAAERKDENKQYGPRLRNP